MSSEKHSAVYFQGRPPSQKPAIVFLTNRWTEVTDFVRMGRHPAGTASVCKTWKHFARRGWDVHVLVLSDDPCPSKPWRTRELNGITFYWLQRTAGRFRAWCDSHQIPLVHWVLTPFDWIKTYWTIGRYLPRADVYYSMRHAWGIVAWSFARMNSAKCVVRYFGNFVYPAWRDKSLTKIIKTAPCLLVMKWPVDLHIITQDGSYGARVFQRLHVGPEKWRAWMNGANKAPDVVRPDAVQTRRRLGLAPKSNILLSISRLSTTKRQDRIIKALPRILKEFPNTHLVLIGDGAKRHDLESLVEALNLSSNVSFLGAIPNRQLHDYLHACDIFFQPNDHSSLSTTLIEALTAGCCCVVRNAGEVDAIIDNGNNAILLDPGEAEDLGKAALQLLRSPRERQELGMRAFADALNRFQTWEERLDMEVDEISRLCGVERMAEISSFDTNEDDYGGTLGTSSRSAGRGVRTIKGVTLRILGRLARRLRWGLTTLSSCPSPTIRGQRAHTAINRVESR